MKIFSFAFLVPFVRLFPLLVLVPTAVGFAEVIQQDDLVHSVVTVVSEEDIASTHADVNVPDDVPRVLKKKRKKNPKGGKVSKSAKGSTPDPACAPISSSTAKDALLALKKGFDNGGLLLTDWVDTTEPCTTGDTTSNWGDSITCSTGGEVTKIDISKCNLF